MNRAAFINRLRQGLSGLPQSYIDDVLADYEEHFAEGLANGRSEDDVAAALGDPARLARELRAEAGIRRWENERSAANFVGVVVALLGLATIDVVFIFPFLCVMAGIFFGCAIAFVALIGVGFFFMFSILPFWNLPDFGSTALRVLVGVGLVAGGVGGGALLIMALNFTATLLIKFARLHYRLLDSANDSV